MDIVSKLREAYQSWNDTKGLSTDQWMELMSDDVVFFYDTAKVFEAAK